MCIYIYVCMYVIYIFINMHNIHLYLHIQGLPLQESVTAMALSLGGDTPFGGGQDVLSSELKDGREAQKCPTPKGWLVSCIYIYMYTYLEPINDPCFGWKRPCFGGLTFKKKEVSWVLGIYIYIKEP